jgi:RNA polymerase sigma factor (sigma-70 family)
MIDIVNIGKQKTKYNNKNKIKFESLDFYINLAQKSISKFADQICQGSAKRMLQSEDAISNIANGIMMADWRWDSDRKGKDSGKGKTRYSYRNQCAIWSIKSYITRQYSKKNQIRHQTLSLDQEYNDDLNLQNIVSKNNHNNVLEDIIHQEEKNIISQDIHELLNSGIISDRQANFIRMYFFEDMTLENIGKQYNITREAVRQNLNKAYNIIRKVVGSND